MSNKILFRFVVAFGGLVLLLVFLGVNYVPHVSAMSSAKENAADVAINAGTDWIERQLANIAKPVNYAGAEVAGTGVKIAPVFDTTGAVVSNPTGTMLNMNQSVDMAVPVTSSVGKIAPVFDTTGAVVSDPTGTLLSVINP